MIVSLFQQSFSEEFIPKDMVDNRCLTANQADSDNLIGLERWRDVIRDADDDWLGEGRGGVVRNDSIDLWADHGGKDG